MISYTNFRQDVPIVELAQVVEFLDNKRKPITEKDRVAGPYPYYGANGVQDYVADWIFDEDLILLAEDGGHFENPDRGVAYKITGKTWVNNHAHVLRAKKVDVDYLKHTLKNMDLMPYVNGATRLKLTKSSAEKIKIPLPPLAEQKRIAAILDKAAEIKAKREQAIAKLDELAQSTFVEMFGSNPRNAHRGKLVKLSDLCDLQNGYAFKSDDYVESSSVLNCRMSNIRPNGDFDILYSAKYLPDSFAEKHKSFLLADGDVIIAMTDMAGEPKILGVPTIVDTKGYKLLLNQRVGKLTFNGDKNISLVYLKYALSQPYIKQYYRQFASGGVQINLGKADLLSVELILPSSEAQSMFARKIEIIHEQKKRYLSSLSVAAMTQVSLQHQAFTTGFNA